MRAGHGSARRSHNRSHDQIGRAIRGLDNRRHACRRFDTAAGQTLAQFRQQGFIADHRQLCLQAERLLGQQRHVVLRGQRLDRKTLRLTCDQIDRRPADRTSPTMTQ